MCRCRISHPPWRIATTDPAPVLRLRPQTGERRLDVLRWGLVPHWIKEAARALRPVNARSAIVSTSAMFRGAYRERRCLVPVDGWYEWQKRPNGRKHAPILSNASGSLRSPKSVARTRDLQSGTSSTALAA
jgi:putative SOS response-associated peptidase YedK